MKFPDLLRRREIEDAELLQSTSRKVILTTSAIYLLWHFIATLGWPAVFSPSLWSCTLLMLCVILLSLRLLGRHLYAAHAVWFAGLGGTILLAYSLYLRPEIAFLLALFPMMAEVMLGLRATVIVEAAILLLAFLWGKIPFHQPLPGGYPLAVGLLSLATTLLGWGLADNLVSAIEASSYHYREALKRLEEARQHRAEISVLLKEVSKANYQLDRLNNMLSFARAKAEEAREERDRFALAVSHELRSPLNYIIGFSDLMVNSPETYGDPTAWPPGLYDDIQEIYRSSNHLMGLINDILDMGKIDAQQMTLFKEKVELSAIVSEVRDMVSHSLELKDLYFQVELDPGLPVLYVDRTRIRQVLLNLVTNGLRFTRQGGITLRARCEKPDLMQVEVQDTGSGIAKEDLPKIFNEFRQVGNQNWRREEGTGLGLAIGRRFIQLHGGEMGARSELGQGSTFFFTLPILHPIDEPGALGPLGWPSSSHPPVRGTVEDKNPLLLFLSADPFWARIFAESLTGFKITLLTDPEQLLPLTNELYPHAVIVDQAILGMETVQEFIRNPPYDLPVITFAIPININRVTALPTGAVSYLLKPVHRNKIIETVRSLGPDVRTLLVVDDDPSMVRFVTQSLKSGEGDAGALPVEYTFLTALDGAQALYHLHSTPVDAVLLDLDLPDINGLSLIEQMQKDEQLRLIPVIIVSANDLPQSLNTQQGVFQVLVNRPFTNNELKSVLTAALNDVSLSYTSKEPAN